MKGMLEAEFTKSDVVKKKGGKEILKGVPLKFENISSFTQLVTETIKSHWRRDTESSG